jgi:4-amino-4-deoxy-L-arabinose transferase-like glycosyltransferase
MTTATAPSIERKTRPGLLWRLAPGLLALYFAISAMWGVWNTDIVDTDAARHAMNGAFIYDLVRSGHLLHPVDYAEQYYGRLPALSMPYHPPLFPAIEAVFFALFGVKLFAARLAVAISVGICVILFYRLIERALESRVLAISASITMFSLWVSHIVARDVMLEYPALALMLAGVLFLLDWDGHLSLKHALGFAVFASLAFWTKQHAVILGGIPPLYALLTGRWRQLLRFPALAALTIFGASVACYILLSSRFHNAGIHEAATSASDLRWIAMITVPTYLRWMKQGLMGVPALFAACAVLLFLVSLRRRKPVRHRLGLFWAWIVSGALVLADLGNTDYRYLFFLYPPVFAIGYAWAFQGAVRIWGQRRAEAITLGFALLYFVSGFWVPREYLRGPGAAASAIVKGQATRILYAGEADGNFVFGVRALDPNHHTTVIPGGKLPKVTFQPEELKAFCRQYGVEWIVVESGPIQRPWSTLGTSPPAFLKLDREFPLESSRERWRTGGMDVFRVQVPSSAPGGDLKLPIGKLGRNITVKL